MTTTRRGRAWAALTLAASTIVVACAQIGSPPGGEPDREPPRVVESTPAQGAVVPGFRGPVRIRFDETVSREGPREVVLVSPEDGEIEVDRGGSELRISMEGGWRTGKVYHITVLPGLQDRRRNVRTTTYQLVFSTGPAIQPTAAGGIVTDRLTARPIANARVTAVSAADSTVYATVTDTAGFYAFQSLPVGSYTATAFVDQNRNNIADRAEPRDAITLTINTSTDTVVRSLSLLAPDSTPARLVRAEARDSLQVRLRFDDYIDPALSLQDVRVRAWQLPDSTALSGGELLHVHEYERLRRALRDTAAADTLAVPPRLPREVARDTSGVAASQELVWVPAQPLQHRSRYRINIDELPNIAGVPGGGGSYVFETPSAPRPPAQRTDTTSHRSSRL